MNNQSIKKKKYIVRHWFMLEEVCSDLSAAKKYAKDLEKMDKRKDIEIVEVEVTEKIL